MKRVLIPVTDAQARERLKAFRATAGIGPHKASQLSDVIWPNNHFRNAQGAGRAASRVIKRLGCQWTVTTSHRQDKDWGWLLIFSDKC